MEIKLGEWVFNFRGIFLVFGVIVIFAAKIFGICAVLFGFTWSYGEWLFEGLTNRQYKKGKRGAYLYDWPLKIWYTFLTLIFLGTVVLGAVCEILIIVGFYN